MIRIYGYLKDDLNKQNLQVQIAKLKAAGAIHIYQENTPNAGCSTKQLRRLMKDVRNGDTVVVPSLNHIARNTKHLLEMVELLSAAGAALKVIDNGIDTSTSHGEAIKVLLNAIVEFERQAVRERQAAGIARAKREGRYKGRKPTARAKTDEVLALSAQGLTRQKIADQLGIGVASVYRILKTHSDAQKKTKKLRRKPIVKQIVAANKTAPEKSNQPESDQMSLF